MPLFNAPRSIANRHRDSPCAIFLVTDRANSRIVRRSSFHFFLPSRVVLTDKSAGVVLAHHLNLDTVKKWGRRGGRNKVPPLLLGRFIHRAGTIGKTRNFVAENARIRAGSRIIKLGIKRISKRSARRLEIRVSTREKKRRGKGRGN